MTNLAKVKKEVSNELPQMLAMFHELQEIEICDEDDHLMMVDGLREIKERHRLLEERRKKITVPLNEALREVNELFRAPKQALERCERLVKDKIANYLEGLNAANEKALAAAAEADSAEEAQEALAEVVPVETAKGISIRYKWRAEVFRPELVPYEFCSPDLNKIEVSMQQSANVLGEPMPIPGVRFLKEPIVTSRSVKT